MRALRLTLTILCLAAVPAQAQYVEDSIDVGGAWVGSLAYNSREDVLYGASESGWFFAISCGTNQVVAQYPLYGAFSVCFDSTDNKAYCTFHDYAWHDSLLVVDGQTHSRVKAISIPGATEVVWDPVSNRLYVTCQSMNRVAVIDCATDSLVTYIPVGACPIKLYLNTLRRKLYVLNYDDGSVSVVDLVTWQVQRTVRVGGNPNAGHYSRRVDKFYCGGEPGFAIAIDGRTNGIVARIPVAWHGDVIGATGSDVSNLVLFGVSASQAAVYAATTLGDSVTAVIPVSGSPWGLASSQQTGMFYCGNARRDSVLVLAGDGSHVKKTLAVGRYPFVFVVVARHNRVYVGDLGNRRVYVVRDTTTGIAEEAAGAERGERQTATVVRGVLFLSETASSKPQAASSLLDIGGRKVLDLRPGANDVSRLAPGVYFVRQTQAQAVRRVVVTK